MAFHCSFHESPSTMQSLHISIFLKRTLWLFIFASLELTSTEAQTLEDILSTLVVDEEENILSMEELEILESLVRQPVNLNNAGKRRLEMIPLFALADIQLILAERRKKGKFQYVDEVAEISGLSLIAQQLLPLISTVERVEPVSMAFRNRWATSNEDYRLLNRALFVVGETSGGIVVERDPLEPTLADFISAHTKFKTRQGVEVIVGDHRVESGYGLVFGRISRPMKGGWQVTSVSRAGRGLRSYQSSSEYWGLRGLGLRTENSFGRWTASVSSSPADAIMKEDQVVSVQRSGLHSSATSIARKHNIREEILLLNWESTFNNGQIGAMAVTNGWQIPSANRQFEGSYLSQYGDVPLLSGSLFWEAATTPEGKSAWLGGVTQNTRSVRWISMLRHYPEEWHTPRSTPFSEWSGNELNETGIYQAMVLRVGKLRISSYGDLYREYMADETGQQPIVGAETAVMADYRWRGEKNVVFKWKSEEKSLEDKLYFPKETITPRKMRQATRLQGNTKLGRTIRIRLQVDHVRSEDSNGQNDGNSLSFTGAWDTKQHHLSIQWIVFNTSDYSSRVYVWGLNLPGEMRNYAYYGNGHSSTLRYRFLTVTGTSVSFRTRSSWENENGKWSPPRWEGGFQMDLTL